MLGDPRLPAVFVGGDPQPDRGVGAGGQSRPPLLEHRGAPLVGPLSIAANSRATCVRTIVPLTSRRSSQPKMWLQSVHTAQSRWVSRARTDRGGFPVGRSRRRAVGFGMERKFARTFGRRTTGKFPVSRELGNQPMNSQSRPDLVNGIMRSRPEHRSLRPLSPSRR